jgi:hypothetical protein
MQQLGADLRTQAQAVPQVNVYLGNELINDHIDTRITSANRATRRTVSAGAGTTF